MKIAYDVLKAKGYSGNQTYTNELIKALVREFPENKYHIITNWRRKNEAINAFGTHTSLHYHNIMPNRLVLGKKFQIQVQQFNQKLLVATTRKYDIYHATNPVHFPQGARNGVVTLHDLIALKEEPWGSRGSKEFYRQHIRSILQHAKLIFCVSEYTAQDAIARFPELSEKVKVTPLAANPVFRALKTGREFMKPYGIRDIEKPFLLFVGEIQPRKNLESVLTCFNALPTSLKQSLQLIIIGSARLRGNQRLLETQLNNLQSQENVYQLQNVSTEDLVRFYNTAHIFLFPSFFEGFGLPVIEAMSCGCPVITSNTSSLKEVAADAALTVSPYQNEELRETMIQLIEDTALRDTCRQKGLKRAREFSWSKTAHKTMEGYQQVLETS